MPNKARNTLPGSLTKLVTGFILSLLAHEKRKSVVRFQACQLQKSCKSTTVFFMNLSRHPFLKLDMRDGCAEGVGHAFVPFGYMKEVKT